MSQLKNVGIDLDKYNQFPQLDNLKNVLQFFGIELKPDMFGCRTIGFVDKVYEVMVNNCKIPISIPDLRIILILHSYYLRFQQENAGFVDLVKFFEEMDKVRIFDGLSDEEIITLKEKFNALLPIFQQLKQYD